MDFPAGGEYVPSQGDQQDQGAEGYWAVAESAQEWAHITCSFYAYWMGTSKQSVRQGAKGAGPLTKSVRDYSMGIRMESGGSANELIPDG